MLAKIFCIKNSLESYEWNKAIDVDTKEITWAENKIVGQ